MLKYIYTRLPGSFSGRALALAALFVTVFAIALTLSPARNEPSQIDLDQLLWQHWIGVFVWGASFYLLHRETRRHLPKHDSLLIPLAALLSGWGLLTIWRLTNLFGLRQSAWIAVCSIGFIFLLRNKDKILPTLSNYKYLWLFSGFLITALTFFFGTNPSGIGPRLWLGCCGIYFQPSEPLKLLLIIYLAAYLADKQALIKNLLPLLAPTALMTGMALLLLFTQRDLGTAWVFILIYMVLIYFATGLRRILLLSLLSIALALFLGNEFIPLVNSRIEGWLNPWLDPSAGGYQIVQGLLAIAAGGLFGRGPGLGNPELVPISLSDFIYTSIVEETGTLGAVALLLLISLFALRALRISLKAKDAFQTYLALGLSAYIATQSLLIIGGNIRMLPLTGVTLPFVSYGGSSLLTSLFALLLLALISHESAGYPAASPSRFSSSKTIAAAYLTLFGLAALVTAWWGLARAPDLLTRPDNARRAYSEQQVQRGALLDRNQSVLIASEGDVNGFSRKYLYPQLSSVLGYSHPIYGQTGLELGLDEILRGEELQSAGLVSLSQLVYGQNPPGLNVSLSLDLDLQLEAADLLADELGAAAIINSETGEILLMTSIPSYNANTLNENWEILISEGSSPLLNRASYGSYPPGTALGPFIYTAARMQALALPTPGELTYMLDETEISCLRPPQDPEDWGSIIAASCPGPIAELGLALEGETLFQLFTDLGFYSAPSLRTGTFSADSPSSLSRPGLAAIGQSGLRISPLQMVIAASTLSNFGQVPAPQIALAVEEESGAWIDLAPLSEPRSVLNSSLALAVAQSMNSAALPLWQHSARSFGEEGQIFTWYLAGTIPGQAEDEDSLTIVVLLEKDEAALAQAIGQRLLITALDG